MLTEAERPPYAVEINVVRTGRLWPRSIAPPSASTKRRKEMNIMVGVGGEDDREKTSG